MRTKTPTPKAGNMVCANRRLPSNKYVDVYGMILQVIDVGTSKNSTIIIQQLNKIRYLYKIEWYGDEPHPRSVWGDANLYAEKDVKLWLKFYQNKRKNNEL